MAHPIRARPRLHPFVPWTKIALGRPAVGVKTCDFPPRSCRRLGVGCYPVKHSRKNPTSNRRPRPATSSPQPPQRLRSPFHLPLFPRPQRRRRFARFKPERHPPSPRTATRPRPTPQASGGQAARSLCRSRADAVGTRQPRPRRNPVSFVSRHCWNGGDCQTNGEP